jgi:hypothetical protein
MRTRLCGTQITGKTTRLINREPSEDVIQIVWDSNYRNGLALAEPEDPSQGDSTSRNNAQSSRVGEARCT